ncbi:uncharacterized protein LOC110006498 [Amborella trichopoda]|uniref:uncharacterized protein LOC110006498 n=1 Tax=Amborella trichopoda TaxID=13333 RepID=UPI0009C01650|nr:uncharacterized protein LOC110006498 [Amborella trichopoda]|eukprot:XP_020517779.1 uncharacterized protein LOC110006498 [Amborella trichopoda]
MNLPSSVWHIVNQLKIVGVPRVGGILWNMFRGSLLWEVWLERNRTTFEGVAVDLATVENKILLNTWNWFRITKEGWRTSRMDVDENLDQLILLRFIKVRPRSSRQPPLSVIKVRPRSSRQPPLSVIKVRPRSSRQPPLSGCFKLNVDGSFMGNLGRVRIGGVSRDSSGNLAFCFAGPCGNATANYAEMAAVLQGIELWKEMSLGDSKNAMDWCNYLSITPWRMVYIWLHI